VSAGNRALGTSIKAALIRKKGNSLASVLVKGGNSALPRWSFPARYRDGAELENHRKIGVWRYRDLLWGDKLLYPLLAGTLTFEHPI
jgi:hypothetical protein